MTTKACPQCGRIADLHAAFCTGCNRRYNTQFAADGTILRRVEATEVIAPAPRNTQCPTCGFMLTAFDAQCERCKWLALNRPAPLPQTDGPAQSNETLPHYTTPGYVAPPPQYAQPPAQMPYYPPQQYPPPQPMQPQPMQQSPYANPNPYGNPMQPAHPYQQPSFVPPGSIYTPQGTHSVALAVVIGFIFNGGGQIVNRQYAKGILLMIVGVILALIIPILGWFAAALFAWIDCIAIANRINRGEVVGQWQFF